LDPKYRKRNIGFVGRKKRKEATESIIGKYKFYPYEFDKRKTLILEELAERFEKIKAKKERVKKSVSRGKRRGKE
jgi:hypothetical protein